MSKYDKIGSTVMPFWTNAKTGNLVSCPITQEHVDALQKQVGKRVFVKLIDDKKRAKDTFPNAFLEALPGDKERTEEPSDI